MFDIDTAFGGIAAITVSLSLIIVAVALLAAQAFVFNRLSGISYPLWAPRAAAPAEGFVPLALETDEAATPSDPYAAVANQLVRRGALQRPGGKK